MLRLLSSSIHPSGPFTMLELLSTSISDSAKFALLSIAKVLVMCGTGCLFATNRIGILTPGGIKLLSKLVFMLFLPSLIFTELGSAITFQKMLQWWFIPVNVLISSVLGSIIGFIVMLIVRPPLEFRKFTVVMIGIGNIGNIPLVLIGALCGDASNPFGDSDTCSELGTAYISFGQWVGAVVVYTYVYRMFSPYDVLGAEEEACSLLTIPLTDPPENGHTKQGKTSLWWKMKVSRASQISEALQLKQIFQPPVSASILSLIVGAIPFLKNLFLVDNAPLSFFTDSLSLFGSAMIPCILLSLGGNLAGGPGNSRLGLRTTIAITFTRLLIIPPMGMGVVYLADKLGFLPENDQLFRFVLLLQHTMPSSILAGAVAVLRGVCDKEASAVLFWEHICAVGSIALWLTIYLKFMV